jgi:hypothetical protein
VKKRRLQKRVASAHAKTIELEKGLIRHSRVLDNPLHGGLLTREHGRKQLLHTVEQAYTQNWEVREILNTRESGSSQETSATIGAFDFDPVTRSLYYRMFFYTPQNVAFMTISPSRIVLTTFTYG